MESVHMVRVHNDEHDVGVRRPADDVWRLRDRHSRLQLPSTAQHSHQQHDEQRFLLHRRWTQLWSQWIRARLSSSRKDYCGGSSMFVVLQSWGRLLQHSDSKSELPNLISLSIRIWILNLNAREIGR